MKEWASKVVGDVKFFLWRSKKVNYRRYVSIAVIVAVLAGLSFFSLRTTQVKAASSASWDGNTISISGSDANFMLLKTTNSTNVCLRPLNYWSANNFTYKPSSTSYAKFVGNACTNSPGNLTVIVQDYASLSVVGDISLSTLTLNTHGVVTSAPADSAGMAVPYSSRSDYFATRYTGFTSLSMSGQTAASTKRRLMMRISSNDDAAIIETGGTSADVAIDSVTWNPVIHQLSSGGCDLVHSSFRYGCPGSTFVGDATEGVIIDQPFGGSGTYYVPVRMTSWEITGETRLAVQYKVLDLDNADVVKKTIVDWTNLPLSNIYPPKVTYGADLGYVDTGNPNMMRFEMSNVPIGRASGMVDASLQNYYTWVSSNYQYQDKADYKIFPRVDLRKDKTFTGFMQARATDIFSFVYVDPNVTVAGNPFSNSWSHNGDGFAARDYNLGMAVSGAGKPSYMQNYKLQYHDETATAATAVPAGIKLAVSGDMVMMADTKVQGSGLGLPGGEYTYGIGDNSGAPGIGGMGKGANPVFPGWYWGVDVSLNGDHGPNPQSGSNWSNFNGGGGGTGGQYGDSIGSGAGGGGVIGRGSTGLIYNTNSGASYGTVYLDHSIGGTGGGGIFGTGGGVNSSTYAQEFTSRANGHSDRARYTDLNIDDFPNGGMGGGGGTSSRGGNVPNMPNNHSYAGDGGGLVRLTVGGNLSINGYAGIMADGGGGYNDNGGGGGGSLNIKVTGQFDLSSFSYLTARGGSGGNRTVDGTYSLVAGNGGGGLIKVRAGSYKSTLINQTDSSAWPSEAVACTLKGMLQSNGRLYIDSGEATDAMATTPGLAESGMIDLAYMDGNQFCGGTSSSVSGNIQITKRIEQMNQGATENVSDDAAWTNFVGTDGNWNNIVTVVPGGHIRTVITVTNPDSTTINNAKITDKLPFGDMTIDRDKIMIRRNGSVDNFSPKAITVTAGSFEFTYNLLGNSKYEFMYTSVTTSPFSN